jgi:acetyl esterase/lipase
MKSTRHLVDPELWDYVDSFPGEPITADTLSEYRSLFGPTKAPNVSVAGVERTEMFFPGYQGDPEVRVLMFRPIGATDPLAVLLHFHGGGFIVGCPEMAAADCANLAFNLQCAVVSVDYRLAPENPHPGPVHDCYAVLEGIWRSADALNLDRDRIAVMGESAGGGLAAAVALMARDIGEVRLVFQLLVTPMLDDRTGRQDDYDGMPFAGEFIWDRERNCFGWNSLLGPAAGSNDVHPYAAPARAPDLARLPTTFISTGALDLFAEENMEYARRLLRSGVPVELHLYPGAVHGYRGVASSRLAMRADADRVAALQKAFMKSTGKVAV